MKKKKIINKNTPLEKYNVNGIDIYVKREDLAVTKPAPPFSKMRGIVAYLKRIKEESNITTVGYTETSISMAGWGVAWACEQLGMKAVIFDPQYKHNTPETLIKHRKMWKKFNADIIPLRAGILSVSHNIARNIMREKYPNSLLLPMGLPFKETLIETEKELKRTKNIKKFKSIVMVIGSGTIASGVWNGLEHIGSNATIYGIMCSTGNTYDKMQSIRTKAQLNNIGLFKTKVSFELIDEGWKYTNPAEIESPFPCNKFYDLKAWDFLVNNIKELEQPILFWNIGQ